MFNRVIMGQYIPANSLIHQLDPRTKIIAVSIMMIAIFLISQPFSFFMWFIWLSILIGLTKISPAYLIRGAKPIFFIVIFTAIIHMILTPGEVVYKWGIVTITSEGIQRGLLIGTRIIFLVFITSLLTLTTSPLELTNGLETLFKPLKKVNIPVHELAMMMTIALRFIPTLMEETERILKAQMARGLDFRSGSLVKRLGHIVPIMVPLFISAFRRADELALAMECRCYRGGEGRTKYKNLKYTTKDQLAIILVLAITVGTIITG